MYLGVFLSLIHDFPLILVFKYWLIWSNLLRFGFLKTGKTKMVFSKLWIEILSSVISENSKFLILYNLLRVYYNFHFLIESKRGRNRVQKWPRSERNVKQNVTKSIFPKLWIRISFSTINEKLIFLILDKLPHVYYNSPFLLESKKGNNRAQKGA